MVNEKDKISDLLSQLKKLQSSQFDEVVVKLEKLEIDTTHIRTNGTQTQKAIDLINLIKQQQDGIESLNKVLNSYTKNPDRKEEQIKQNVVVVFLTMVFIGFLWHLINGDGKVSPKYVSCQEYYDKIGAYCRTRKGDDCSSCPVPTP